MTKVTHDREFATLECEAFSAEPSTEFTVWLQEYLEDRYVELKIDGPYINRTILSIDELRSLHAMIGDYIKRMYDDYVDD